MDRRARLLSAALLAAVSSILTVSGAAAQRVAEPPANGRIAFGYRGQLIVTHPDGSGQWPLTPVGLTQTPGDWSPDGTRLVVARYTDERHASLYLLDGRGSEIARLTDMGAIGEYDPSFSADGSQIAYESFSADRPPQIWVMNSDGSRQRYLAAGYPSVDPEWSPDGKRFAWTLYAGGGPDVWVMEVEGNEGSNRRQLTRHPGVDENPSWSPDGTRIAFDSDRSGNLDVYTMKTDGTDVRRLTTSPALDAIPVWSPDGRRIAFVSERRGNRSVFVMDADGGRVTRVSVAADPGAGPAWQPLPRRPRAAIASGSRCTIWGTEGADILVGRAGRDVLCGLGGDDRMLGGDGGDVVVGGPGDDSIVGGPGADRILAGPGDDTMDARDGARDIVDGGGGRNTALLDGGLDRRSKLARALYPDPRNLLRGHPVRASSSAVTTPVEYAVDGHGLTEWDPDRYTRHWIEADLGRPTSVGRVEMLLSDDAADVKMRFVVLGKGEGGGWRRLGSFEREILSGRLARYRPASTWRNVRWLRIVTHTDGDWFAWKEFRAYAQ